MFKNKDIINLSTNYPNNDIITYITFIRRYKNNDKFVNLEITNYFFIDKVFSKVSDVDANHFYCNLKKDIYSSGELVGEMTDEALIEKSKFYNNVILRNPYLIKNKYLLKFLENYSSYNLKCKLEDVKDFNKYLTTEIKIDRIAVNNKYELDKDDRREIFKLLNNKYKKNNNE